MKILSFIPFADARGHHETDIEFALEMRADNHEIFYLQCASSLTACDINPDHKWHKCQECHSTSNRSLDLLEVPATHRVQLVRGNNRKLPILPKFKNVEELKNFEWQGHALGSAVAASVILITRDTDPDFDRYGSFVQRTAEMFCHVYFEVKEAIEKIKPDLLYVFNGKSGVMNAAFCAAKEAGVRVAVGERDSYRKYLVLDNAICIDLEYLKNSIADFEKRMQSDPAGETQAKEWFLKNRNGNKELLCNYLRNQKNGELPEGFDPQKRNFVIFQSSDDEIASDKYWAATLFPSQTVALKETLEKITDPNIHFYVRLHPNLIGLDNAQTRMFSEISAPNLTMVAADSKIDSYALMEACEKVIVFQSTIGIESVFWNKPVILIGRAVYEDMGAVYFPKTKNDYFDLLKKTIEPTGPSKALAYGYWLMNRGKPFKHIIPANPAADGSQTLYNGKSLGPSSKTLYLLKWYHRWVRYSRKLLPILGQ